MEHVLTQDPAFPKLLGILKNQMMHELSCSAHLIKCVFSSPDPKGHVSFGSGELLPSLGVRRRRPSVVRRKLFQKSSPLKVLDQWKPNLV
jgi:hypothetical protein